MKKSVSVLVGAALVFGSILFGLQAAHADTVPPTCSRFADVPSSSEYAPYICWLASTGVTTGTSATTFSPAASVTREQMAAFLYRMAGKPAFTPPAKPSFSDVPASSEFFMNIEWLKTTGITTGTTPTTFSPTAGVTREQMAAFLYRMAGKPKVTPPAKPSFSDVPTSSEFFANIEWLKTTGITTGTSATTFSPGAIVSRQQMAAFLYRMSTTKLGCTPYPARVGCVLMTGSTPTISGTKAVGSTLTVNVGTWTPSGTTTTVQWNRNGAPISGATRTTYVLVAADGGASITVSVTGTKAGYSPITKTSAAATIPGAPFVTAPTPTISGTTMVGSTLTAAPGTWNPSATLTYQWYRNGSAISGATAKTYTLTTADGNATMTVKVTATLAGYATTSKTSAPTSAVQPKASVSFTAVTPYPAVSAGRAIPAGTSLISNLTASATPTITCAGLPSGVTCNSTTGALSGTPATAGGYLVVVTAKVTIGSQPTATHTTTTELLVAATSKVPLASPPPQAIYPFPPSCSFPYTDACMTQYINDSLRIEGYSPAFTLPANYAKMNQKDQLIAATNAIRTAYGLPTVTHNSAGDAAAQTGAVNDADPIATSSMSWQAWGSNWAGGQPTVLEAVAEWMYQDGPGSNNIECTPTDHSGCYGHRYNVLATWSPIYIAAGYATASWGPSYTTIIWR